MKFHDFLLYLLLRFIKWLIINLPVKFVYCGGRMIGSLCYCFLPERRNITIGNLRKAFPEKNPAWCRLTAKEVFRNFGRNIMEFLKFSGGKIFDRVEVNGLNSFREGALLLMGHLGNWEITGMTLTAAGLELYPVGRRIHSKAFDKIVDDIRTAYGSHHIPYKNSIREILSKIKKKKNICVLIDQRIRSGLPVKFFNRPVWVTHIASVLYRRTGVKVVPGYSYHENDRIIVHYDSPMDLRGEGDSLKLDFINTQKQISWIEEKIRNKPDEWFWMHNFWKDKWPAVFLDRDGTINVDHGYVGSSDKLEFIPGVFEALRELRREGFLLVVVTNQSGISRGYYSETDYLKLNRTFLEKLMEEGVIVDRVYYCPHHPDDNCYFRKPNPGMVEKALNELNIDMGRSYVVGDKVSDIELGKKAGLKTVMVMTGNGREHIKKCSPDYRAEDLLEASRLIIGNK